MSESDETRCGVLAIVGRPNVGKSTLLNQVVGQKLSITSRRPQTTRHRIVGVKTTPPFQAVYVDTPGLHLNANRAMNRHMNEVAESALADVDAILFMVEGGHWTEEDEAVLVRLRDRAVPVLLVVNKIDRLGDKTALLPYLAQIGTRLPFAEVVPISARSATDVARLEDVIHRYLPPGEWRYPGDQVTDRSERFLAAELVREKLMRRLGQEVPHRATVEVVTFEERGDNLAYIDCVIWVEGTGQKAIVLGHGGRTVKAIGMDSRADLESMLGRRVYLSLRVKVREHWSEDARALRQLGYGGE